MILTDVVNSALKETWSTSIF